MSSLVISLHGCQNRPPHSCIRCDGYLHGAVCGQVVDEHIGSYICNKCHSNDAVVAGISDIGNAGITGNAGNTGNTGNTGDTGSTGDSGNTGITGNTGNAGNTGNSCARTGYTHRNADPEADDECRIFASQTNADNADLDQAEAEDHQYSKIWSEYREYVKQVYRIESDDPSELISTVRVYKFLYYHANRGSRRVTKGTKLGPKSRRVKRPLFDIMDYNRVSSMARNGTLVPSDNRIQCIDTHIAAIQRHATPNQIFAIKHDPEIKKLRSLLRPRKRLAEIAKNLDTHAPEVELFQMEEITSKLEEYFWKKRETCSSMGMIAASLRNRYCMLDSLQTLVRGNALVNTRLADNFVVRHKVKEEHDECVITFQQLLFGK